MKTKTLLCLITTALILCVFTTNNSFSQSWYENWDRHPQNPIMDGPVNWTDDFYYPVVIYDQDIYKMWFTGWMDAREIGYAESEDGYSWEIHQMPVISSGAGWDYHRFAGPVLRVDDTLRMWYFGAVSNWSSFSMGYAWSLDGITWQVNFEPVLNGVSFPSMYYDGTIFHMYYTSGLNQDIDYATSEDGIIWEKYENNPVIERGQNGTWNDTWVIPDGLIMHNDTLHMFLTGHDGTANAYFFRTGYAWSVDYTTWNVNDEYVFDVVPGGWESLQVGAGTILFEYDRYKMWYMGYSTSDQYAIGYAECEIDITCLSDGYYITSQSFIDNFPENYPNCKEIKGDLTISGNNIDNLDGLMQIEIIDGNLDINNNPELENLSGLGNLSSINGDFVVNTNNILEDFSGLENLNSIDGDLKIFNNVSLTSLTGLDNIAQGSINDLTIAVNNNLSLCAIISVCEYLFEPNGTVTIQDNASGCNSQQELEEICWVNVNETQYISDVSILPNPFINSTTLEYELYQPAKIQINIYNHLGEQVELIEQMQPAGKQQVIWNAEGLPAGVYYCVLKAKSGTHTLKMIKLN